MKLILITLLSSLVFLGTASKCSNYYDKGRKFSTITCTNVPATVQLNYNFEMKKYPQDLVVVQSKIPKFPPNTLLRFSTIRKLSLNRLNIQELMPGAFNGLITLQELYLSYNELTVIPQGVFNSLNQLRVLHLDSNKIKKIDQRAFVGMVYLQKLNLVLNLIERLDGGLFQDQRKSLQSLQLYHNKLKEFRSCYLWYNSSKCFSTSTALTFLYISHNEITNYEFNVLGNLESLYSSENKITVLEPGSFRKMQFLKFLDIGNNNIEKLSYGTFQNLPRLEKLYLRGNKLKQFQHYSFVDVGNLSILNLTGNEINYLGIENLESNLKNLELVALDKNPFACDDLAKLDYTFRNMKIVLTEGVSFHVENYKGNSCKSV